MPNEPTDADRAAALKITKRYLNTWSSEVVEAHAAIIAGCMQPERERVKDLLSLCQAFYADGCKSIELASVKHYLTPPSSKTEDQADA